VAEKEMFVESRDKLPKTQDFAAIRFVYSQTIERSYIEIPTSLRMDDGNAQYVSRTVEQQTRAAGNAVAVPVARWLGERILEFDKQYYLKKEQLLFLSEK
jgi:site-specific DNA-cytosine methylase